VEQTKWGIVLQIPRLLLEAIKIGLLQYIFIIVVIFASAAFIFAFILILKKRYLFGIDGAHHLDFGSFLGDGDKVGVPPHLEYFVFAMETGVEHEGVDVVLGARFGAELGATE
jgi:hypothetical protein